MRDLPREQQFLLEAPFNVLRGNRVPRDFGTNHFQRDGHFQLGIPRLVDGSHTANTKLFQDVIARPELLADVQWPPGSLSTRRDGKTSRVRWGCFWRRESWRTRRRCEDG